LTWSTAILSFFLKHLTFQTLLTFTITMPKKSTIKQKKPRDTLLRREQVIFDKEIAIFKNTLGKSLTKAEKNKLIKDEEFTLASRIKNGHFNKENVGI
jgi:hypothetical protein